MKKLLTVEEVGEAIGFKKSTIYELIASGRLESVKIGTRARRVPVEALDAFIEDLRDEGREAVGVS